MQRRYEIHPLCFLLYFIVFVIFYLSFFPPKEYISSMGFEKVYGIINVVLY
jgi:hypothetical protein